ncbi:MAG TPA: signal recognition particle-docking protein FtsY [Aestuariivirgaceae bacterium]|nr:signal recognition particle-docking protein FtsY [Aestuariivirgaceae bacterium]
MSLFRNLFARNRPDAEAPVADPVAPTETSETADAGSPSAGGWFQRLRSGLSKSSDALGAGITGIFTRRRLDATTLAELEDILIGADLGPATAARITRTVGEGRYDREIAPDEVRSILAAEIEKILAPVERSFTFEDARRPFVILVVGVNGSGKTTTIGKLGAIARREGLSVMLAACDTFRAAAIEQLEVWGRRIGASVMTGPAGADAAGLAYDAYVEARARGLDTLIIDTAGRLQNRADLMAELEKIIRVLKKIDPDAPHATLLVLDATTGQNALNQVEVFRRMAGITGIVMTKLDGTARGGILVAIAERFGLPVHAVGVGEQADDLQPFAAAAFARAIAGIGEDRA